MTIDEPKRRTPRPRPAAPTTPDPVEIAMEAEASGEAPIGEAAALLRRHSALIDKQLVLAGNEIFRNRIRSIRDIAIVAVVVLLIVAAGVVVWSASRTTGLVIQPFTVPPDLVEDGMDGRAVAALFHDELIRLERVTESARPPISSRNDWSGAITVEVEAGGLSLTDAYVSLTRWLGQETYVSGGLTRTPDGLELVVRTSDGVAVTVRGPADRPGDLIRQAGERVLEQTQPYRFAVYLTNQAEALPPGPDRQTLLDRSRAILTSLQSSPSAIERLWANNALAVRSDTSPQDAIAYLETGLEIDAEHPALLANLARVLTLIGRNEAALAVAERAATSTASESNLAKVSADRRVSIPLLNEARLAEMQGDWLGALAVRTEGASRMSTRFFWRDNGRDRVNALIALHEPAQALRLNDGLALWDSSDVFRGGVVSLYLPQAESATTVEQWTEAVAMLEAFELQVSPYTLPRVRQSLETSIRPRLAYARARTGDLAGAQALIAATPLNCYLCVRERARIAELAGDRAAADRWSAEARRQGPSLPFAFAERGQMLMARGDAAGAIAFYEQAVERGSRWADPQKYWGDALMAQGDEAGAIRKYRAAADRAPRWGALYLAWGLALEAQGRRDQAREKYSQAARMDLSATDRSEVVRRLGAVSGGA